MAKTTVDPMLRDLLSLPTAPFCEQYIIDYVLRFCADRGITTQRDEAGNVLIHLSCGSALVTRPLCFTAHMDHPGFVAEKMTRKGELSAHWRGGVYPEYFVGAGVRFFVEDRWVRGKIKTIAPKLTRKRLPVESVRVTVKEPVAPGSIGMWDFPDPVVKGGRLSARGCDCVAGVAALLATIDRVHRQGRDCDLYFLLTRAEEVGFVGAIAAAKSGAIPKHCVVVAVEISSRLPNAELGDGPILRVGDKSSIFTPAATAHCHAAAKALAAIDKKFIYQRKLMDGGTCESTAYCHYGYDATGICIALGNYHNMDTKRKRIAPEIIDLGDWNRLVQWFVFMAEGDRPFDPTDPALEKRLHELEDRYSSLLLDSAGTSQPPSSFPLE